MFFRGIGKRMSKTPQKQKKMPLATSHNKQQIFDPGPFWPLTHPPTTAGVPGFLFGCQQPATSKPQEPRAKGRTLGRLAALLLPLPQSRKPQMNSLVSMDVGNLKARKKLQLQLQRMHFSSHQLVRLLGESRIAFLTEGNGWLAGPAVRGARGRHFVFNGPTRTFAESQTHPPNIRLFFP
jgi:hypothetical protein